MREQKERIVVKLPIDKIVLNEWNPNVQKDAVFNALVENIKEIGMVEPIMVMPPDENGNYKLISGEHRFEACKIVGMDTIDAYVMDDFDEDMAKFQLVRMNVLKGSLDPVKFTKLFDAMADKYGRELTKQMMALVDEKAFETLYVNVRKELPKELQKKMKEAKGELKSVDDLSRILNEMFSTYGDTLKNNFMVFQYGGKTHLWVMMDENLKKKMIDEIVEELKAGNYNINQYFGKLINEYSDKVLAELDPISESEEDIFEEEEEYEDYES